jgi:serine/threonine protein phosphatase 1
MKKRRFCVGDIHGTHKALISVLEQSNFDYDKDKLVCLGDVADSWPEVPECFDELLKIKDLVYILGNHDSWLLDYFRDGRQPYIWTSQGGQASINAYRKKDKKTAGRHAKLLSDALPYWVSEDNKLFVHGGFDWTQPISEQRPYDLTWDRDLFWAAITYKDVVTGVYDEIFMGHTTTSQYDPELKPIHIGNLWNLDQGAGWEGCLTMIDIDTKEYWQSDLVTDLYPGMRGRG